ncbi:hypothetical protein ACFL2D_01470 [Patescibacteria group bacterium]
MVPQSLVDRYGFIGGANAEELVQEKIRERDTWKTTVTLPTLPSLFGSNKP